MAFVITETQNSILSLLFASCVMLVRQLHQCWPSFLIYEMGIIMFILLISHTFTRIKQV